MNENRFYQTSINICSTCNHYPCFCNCKTIENNQNHSNYGLKSCSIYSDENNCNLIDDSYNSNINNCKSSNDKNIKFQCCKKRKNYYKYNNKSNKYKYCSSVKCSNKYYSNKSSNNNHQNIACFGLASLLLFALFI